MKKDGKSFPSFCGGRCGKRALQIIPFLPFLPFFARETTLHHFSHFLTFSFFVLVFPS
jgi:hypothetical protein